MRFKRLRILFNKIAHRREVAQYALFDTLALDLMTGHPLAAKMIEEMVDLFIASGANNYLELRFFNPADMNSYTVLFHKAGALTPAEANVHLRYALERIEKHPKDATEIAAAVLRQMGYKEPLKAPPMSPGNVDGR